jgi:hypothetical protein
MKTIDTTPRLYTMDKALEVAGQMQEADGNGWHYIPIFDPKGTGYAYIAVYDDDGFHVGNF